MPEGGPRGEIFTSEGRTPSENAEAETGLPPAELGADAQAIPESPVVTVAIQKILNRSINFQTSEEFRLALANNSDGIPEDEQKRLVKIFDAVLERKRAVEKSTEEAQRLRLLAQVTERALRGDYYIDNAEFVAQVEKLDPPPSPELSRILLKQYELALNARIEASKNREDLAVAEEYKTIISDIVRSELTGEDVEDAIDGADPELPTELEENIREAARIFAEVPSSTRTAFLSNLDTEDTGRATLGIRNAISRDRLPIPRDEARVTVNKLATTLKERDIVRSLAGNEYEEAVAKLKDLSSSPAKPSPERLQELSERVRALTTKAELQNIYGRLAVQLRPNFDAIFTSIDRLDALPDAGDLADQARDIATNSELTQFETQFEQFGEVSPVSRLADQLEFINGLPERSKAYTRKKAELAKRAYDREAASIRLSFGTTSIPAFRGRLPLLPKEQQADLRQEYQTYLSPRRLEDLDQTATETSGNSAEFNASATTPENPQAREIIEQILTRELRSFEEIDEAAQKSNPPLPDSAVRRIKKIFGTFAYPESARTIAEQRREETRTRADELSVAVNEFGSLRSVEQVVRIIGNPNFPPGEMDRANIEAFLALGIRFRENEQADINELGQVDTYNDLVRDTFAYSYDESQLEAEIRDLKGVLTQTQEERLRQIRALYQALPEEAKDVLVNAVRINNFTEVTKYITAPRDGKNEDPRLISTISELENLLIENQREREIVRDLANDDIENAVKLAAILRIQSSLPAERVEALYERAVEKQSEQTLKLVLLRLSSEETIDFNEINANISRLERSQDADIAALVPQLRELAQNKELARLESLIAAPEVTAKSILVEQLEAINSVPDRSEAYTEKKQELRRDAYEREAVSIRLAFGSDTAGSIRERINSLAENDRRGLGEEYKAYLRDRAQEGANEIDSGEVQQAERETKTQEPKINFATVEPDPERQFDGENEPGTDFISQLENGDFRSLSLNELVERIDKINTTDNEKFRLKKLAALEDELLRLEEQYNETSTASNVACSFASGIVRGQYDRQAIENIIRDQSLPPVIAEQLLALGNFSERFKNNREELDELSDTYDLTSSIADRILANEFLSRTQLERALDEPGNEVSRTDRNRLEMLFNMIVGLPTSVRAQLNSSSGARSFNEPLFQKVRETLASVTRRQSEAARRAQEKTIADAEQAANFIRLRSAVNRNLSLENATEAFRLLTTYIPRSEQEQIEINQLVKLGLETNIGSQTNIVCSELSRRNPDYNSVFIELNKLSQLRASADVNPLDICKTIRSLASLRETNTASYLVTPAGLVTRMRYEEELEKIRERLPLRDNTYVEAANKLRDEALGREYASVELCFYLETANTVLGRIAKLPESTREQVQKKKLLFQEFVDFIAEMRDERPEDYAITSEVDESQIMQGVEYVLQPENLGNNLGAAAYVKAHYKMSMHSWVETLRADKSDEIGATMSAIVPKNKYSEKAVGFRRSTREFRKQRPLSARETAYLESIRALTAPNPLMAAAARADFGSTTAYVNAYLEQLSRKTKETIKDGQYYPVIIIGAGPGGMTAMGSVVRKRPDLAGQTLIIDQAEQVGGPFGVPKGPAWRLNSANQQKDNEFIPDQLPLPDEQTVRGSGSPARGYVAERREENPDSRDFSINMMSSFGVTPDQISPGRYATNEEAATTTGLQAATMCERLALTTRVLETRRAPEDGQRGERLVTLEITEGDLKRVATVRTDLLVPASGGGKESFGFNFEGSQAERIREEDMGKPGVPRISTYLEMLNSLADRTKPQEEKKLGETIVIWGGPGDSERTMKEKLTRIFGESNEATRNIRKIFVIKRNKQEVKRPRYGEIPDVVDRPNRRSIITEIEIDNRVADVGPDPNNPDKVIFYDESGEVIVDPKTQKPISADNAVSTAGFKADIGAIFEADLNGANFKDIAKPYTLPGAPDIAVGDTLGDDKSVLFVQVASNPGFNEAKFNAIPAKTRAALLGIGGNLVAIGVRGADTEAAMNTILDERKDVLKPNDSLPTINNVELKPVTNIGAADFTVPISIDRKKSRIPNNANPNRVASALLSQSFMGSEFVNANSPDRTRQNLLQGTYKIAISIPRIVNGPNNWQVSMSEGIPDGARGLPVPKAVAEELKHTLAEPEFQAYCWQILKNKRGSQPVAVATLSFKRGRIQPAESYVE